MKIAKLVFLGLMLAPFYFAAGQKIKIDDTFAPDKIEKKIPFDMTILHENEILFEKKIFGVQFGSSTIHNTLTEAEALVEYAKNYEFKSIIVTAPPFHQLRSFMTTVGVAIREYPRLNVFSLPGVTQPWNEQVIHSQGVLTAERWQLIQSELKRIEKYTLKGDLASIDVVLDYLNVRDKNLR